MSSFEGELSLRLTLYYIFSLSDLTRPARIFWKLGRPALGLRRRPIAAGFPKNQWIAFLQHPTPSEPVVEINNLVVLSRFIANEIRHNPLPILFCSFRQPAQSGRVPRAEKDVNRIGQQRTLFKQSLETLMNC